jgi:hypothetical protein
VGVFGGGPCLEKTIKIPILYLVNGWCFLDIQVQMSHRHPSLISKGEAGSVVADVLK